MRRIDYYLMLTIGSTMLLAMGGLLGILSVFTLIEQIEDINETYTMVNVAVFVLLSMPRMFYELVPYSALIGCLAGLGILANNSELLVMRAAGVSTWNISWNAMKPALILVLVGLYVGEYILPQVEKTARISKEKALSGNNTIVSTNGFWYREDNVYMHFDSVGQGGVIEGISHYYFDQAHNLKRSLYATRGVFHDVRENEQYWLLENVVLTDIGAETTQSAELTSWRWDTRLVPGLLNAEILVQPDKMSIGELNAKISYMDAQGLNSAKFQLGYWRKVLQPLATIGLVFMAISFVFGPLREATMGMRVVSGLVAGIIFKFVLDLLSPASMVFGFAPMIAVLVPILICFLLGYILFRRTA
ncbi:MAG: LPS export ABC transporter permease LptG [Pseudomonadales bacterium]|nr:LPS export ABC transporter permease LptG [Pseudomonadales bacterium]